MRKCPGCRTPMKALDVQGIEVDSCPKCAGVFLDGNEGGVINVDTGALFGFGARPAGKSERVCPDHETAMMTFRVKTSTGDVDVERAQCCGGVFLDAGEGLAIAEGRETVDGQVGAPRTLKNLKCPVCSSALSVRAFHEVEVDECEACAAFFLSHGEAELAGIDSAALFDEAPWAAPRAGESELDCPECQTKMTLYRPALLGPAFDVHFAECCKGVWMTRSDEAHLRSASRFAVGERADAQFMAGEEVQQSAAAITNADLEARRAASARYAAAAAADRQARMILSTVRSYQRHY